MKSRKDKTRIPILAAGGIVLRGDRRPQFAVVQLRKLGVWALPKGKLAADEEAIAAARREVLEETGHRVTIHEFLGTLAYEASGRPKVVQFWRMQALGEPIGDLMRDVKAVEWFSLEDAIDRLTHLRERVFLEQVGPVALKFAERSARRAVAGRRLVDKRPVHRAPPATHIAAVQEGVPLVSAGGGNSVEHCEPTVQGLIVQDLNGQYPGESAGFAPAPGLAGPAGLSGWPEQARDAETACGNSIEKTLIERTLGWFRHATMPQRPPLD